MQPQALLRASRTALRSPISRGGYGARAISTTQARRGAAAGHEDHYDPPSGWLWGIKPGEVREKEGWEGIWIYGFFGSLIAGVVAYSFKPDTS
jgi:hypothetical protein